MTDIYNKDSGIKEKHITVNTRRRVVHFNLLPTRREHMFNDRWSSTDANDFSRLGHRLTNIRTLILITNIKHPIRVQVRICEYKFKFYDVSPHILMMISLLWGRRMSNMRTFITNLHWQLHHTIRALINLQLHHNIRVQVRIREYKFYYLSPHILMMISRWGRRMSNLILITNHQLHHPIRVQVRICERLFNYLSRIFVTQAQASRTQWNGKHKTFQWAGWS